MDNRYLFKAKRADNGEWVQGNLVLIDDVHDSWKAIFIPKINSRMSVCNENVGGALLSAEPIGSTDLYGRPISRVKPTQLNIGFENWYVVDKSTICQCTGLRDSGGNLIWEHDIVKCCDNNGVEFVASVEFGNPNGLYNWGYQLRYVQGDKPNFDILLWVDMEEAGVNCKIIGNTFDNPELLESEVE